MEKGPEIRIIGNAPTEKKEQARKNIEECLFNHFDSLSLEERKELEKFEYPKSQKEIALINFANGETNKLIEEAGVKPYDIPEKNYHIVPPELYKKIGGNGTAKTFPTKQGIVFNAQNFRNNPVNFGSVVIHETLHLKAHLTLEVEGDTDKPSTTHYREGVSVKALQKHGYHGQYHQHFAGLHEAIVAMQQKKLTAKLLDLPELAKEKEWLMSDEARAMREKLAKENDMPENDIIWIEKDGKDDWETIQYLPHRKVLEYICSETQKQFPDQYQNTDGVFKEFLKAHFTGRLLPISRLVEKTFGEGGFRMLGNMATSEESGILHLESLKKMRQKITNAWTTR